MNYQKILSQYILGYQFRSLKGTIGWWVFLFSLVYGFMEPVMVSSNPFRLDQLLCLVHVVLTISSLTICLIIKRFFPGIISAWETWFGKVYVKQKLSDLSADLKIIVQLFLFLSVTELAYSQMTEVLNHWLVSRIESDNEVLLNVSSGMLSDEDQAQLATMCKEEAAEIRGLFSRGLLTDIFWPLIKIFSR